MSILDNFTHSKPSKDDLYEIHQLEQQCYSDEWDRKCRPLEYIQEMYKYFEDFFMITRENSTGRIVGCIYGKLWCNIQTIDTVEDSSTWEYRSKHGHIFTTDSFCVHPDYRNTGLGESMARYLHNDWILGDLGGPNVHKVTHLISNITSELDTMLIRADFVKICKIGVYLNKTYYRWQKLRNTE